MTNRFRFIYNACVEFFNVTTLSNSDVIKEFLENDDVTVLAAVSVEGEVLLQNAVPVEDQYGLLFYKIPNLDFSGHTGPAKIGLLTLEGGLAKSIYNSLQRVFSPYILKKSEYPAEIRTLLQSLHSSLGLSLGLTESGILSLSDEVGFWMHKTKSLPTKADREAARSFATILERISQQFGDSESMSLSKLDEMIDVCQTALDEIWRLPNHYPQNRMCSIFDMISVRVVTSCTEHLMELDMWDIGTVTLDDAIGHVRETLDSWIQTFDSLTRLFWPNYEPHLWCGEPYRSKLLSKFQTRYKEILDIRHLKDLLYALFFESEKYFPLVNEVTQPFHGMNIYDLTPLGNKRWETARNKMEQALAKIDESAAFVLQQKLLETGGNARHTVMVFNRYKEILTRPLILETLAAERYQVFRNVDTMLKDLREMLSGTNFTESDVTPIVAETRCYRVVQDELRQLESIVTVLCRDREGQVDALKRIVEFREEMEALIRANFETWTENSMMAIRDGELSLRENQPVVVFDKSDNQLMKVTFGPKLVTFIDEARHLQNLGLKHSTEILRNVTHSMRFVAHARRLQQVATFHNTIGGVMVPCIRPIMLKNAMEFSKLVRSESVSWSEEDSVERYIEALQETVKRLLKDNNLLTGYHEQARRSIVKLMDTDLIRQAAVWKEEIRSLREVIVSMERQGYANLNPFKLHWDHQLYKVLEYQYIAGLLDVHHKLPEIHVDLLFRQQRIQLRPTLEEIKSKYYAQVRRFIEKPVNFKGLSDQSGTLFRIMIERNYQHFGVMYEKAEIVFRQLLEFRDSWLPFVALGMVDLEQLCTVHCTSWQHWDNNFRACKRFSQQLARIQEREKEIDCLVVNYAPLCGDIESLSRRYWEALVASLRTSILDSIAEIQEYLAYSFNVLQNIPQDELGIAESSAKYEKITSDLPKMGELMKSLQGKDSCLAGWCKERVSALGGIVLQWNQLQPLIDNHQTLLQGRLDIIKENILRQIHELNDEAEKFAIRWESTIKDLETNDNADMTLFRDRQTQWKQILAQRETLNKQTEKFNITVPKEFQEVFTKLEQDIAEQGRNWQQFNEFLQDFDTVGSEEWTIYRRRPHILTDFLVRWDRGGVGLGGQNVANVASTRIGSMVDRYRSALPVLTTLQSDALIEKHWARLCMLLSIDSRSLHDLCLGDVLAASDRLLEQAAEIQTIVRGAASEHVIRQAIVELEQWAATATLKLIDYTDSRGTTMKLIREYVETLNKIGDNQFLLQSAKNSSAAFESFSDQADVWEEKLNNLDYIVTHLNQIQKRWIYLEPIFGAGTLRKEESVFRSIDKNFRYIMQEIAVDPRVVSIHRINNILSIIDTLQTQISRCQNALSTYIRAKRDAFSRFYFLSDDDLLELLGQSSKEAIIQKHIRKLFPGIYRLMIEEQQVAETGETRVIGFASEEGDEIRLAGAGILITGVPVEQWLASLVERIKETLGGLIGQCLQVGDTYELETIDRFPMQILCLVASINFTRRTEKAIVGMQLANLKQHIQNEIARYSGALQQQQQQEEQQKNTETASGRQLTCIKLRSLLIDQVHHQTTVDYLLAHNVTNLHDWYWLQQLKFYATGPGANAGTNVTVRMVHAEFRYSYEFLGNYNKLVYTSLAHNCYLTLTQAMQLGLGGNPFGPAGTGKTECVKSLGAMLGRLVLVFNCDENIDSAAMGLILSGLARCGAWGCFDEFNRLQEATLSSISMLIQPLQRALKERLTEVQMNGETVPLDQHCCVFVTLNPAGEEYGGRQQLPLNLQALFRPIAMQAPRPQQIARVTLFVEGFRFADRIGHQIVELFELAQRILSRQRHYDWGLRELKAILSACGGALTTGGARPSADSASYEREAAIVVSVIRANLMCRLTATDATRFDVLLGNVFPGVPLTASTDVELRGALQSAFGTVGLQQNERQIEKCLELYAQLRKRMGVVVMGPPQSGKTTLIHLLKEALLAQGLIIRLHTISPKSMARVQLLGKLDPDTRQWTDGVLTSLAVAVNAESRNVTSWIVCDGDVDPEWIEALNSVLDDNRLLTLPSGWRIQFGPNVNFLFETHDLSTASPATISRMGIINLSAADLPYQLLVAGWLAGRNSASAADSPDQLASYCDQHLNRALDWIEQHQERPAGYSLVSLAQSALVAIEPGSIRSSEHFCTGLLCGLSGVLGQQESKNALANRVYSGADVTVTDSAVAEYHYYNSFRDMIELYGTDDITGATIEAGSYTNVLVKTPLMKLASELVKRILGTRERQAPGALLLVGPSGNGKSLLLQSIVGEFAGYQLVTINCSAQLTTASILYTLKQNSLIVTTVKGKEYRPNYARIVLYLRNLDLCAVDGWGTCEVVELLLQLIHRHGFYSEGVEWICVSGMQVCASVADLEKSGLSPRFLSVCRLVRFGYPSEQDMESIVRSVLLPVYNQLAKGAVRVKLGELVRSIINVYLRINERFRHGDATHYRFTPKMIEKWIAGLLFYPQECFEKALQYECRRIFRDRLVTLEQRQQLDEVLRDEFRALRPIDGSELFAPKEGTGHRQRGELEMVSLEQWHQVVDHSVSVCNAESVIVDVPMSAAFYDTVAAICRALVRPSVNLVLAGRSGSGRLQALYTACAQLNVKVAMPQMARQYGTAEFQTDLKLTMQNCALEGEPVVFCLHHAVANFLPDTVRTCEAILAGGELADFFGDDLENVAAPLKAQAALESYQSSPAAYFVQRLKQNFHLVLVLESGCPTVRALFESYPALYQKTEMIWMLPESCSGAGDLRTYLATSVGTGAVVREETAAGGLVAVPNGEQAAIPLPAYFNDVIDLRLSAWSQCPLRRTQLLRCYGHLYGLEKHRKEQHRAKIQIGVDKLSETHRVVEQLKLEAEEKQSALAEKRQLANQSLDMIANTMRSANDKKTELLELQRQTQESSEKLIERKRAIEEELSLVEPVLREASAAVGQIKTEALSEIRSLRAPPEIVRDILEGVLRLMGIRDTSWNSMKTFLAKRGVKEDIRSLDPSRIGPENCAAVEKLLSAKADSYEQRNAKRASAAAAPLAAWVIANVKYAKVMQSIKPLEREQHQLKENLDQAEASMQSLSSGLDNVNDTVRGLSEQLNVYTQEAAMLEIKLEDAKNTLHTAEVLVQSLSSEYTSWSNELDELNHAIAHLAGRSFMTALNLTQLSQMSLETRRACMGKLAELTGTPVFELDQQLVSNQDKIIWESMGLTADQQYRENAGMLSKYFSLPFSSTPVPLLVDPSEYGQQWLVNYLAYLNRTTELTSQSAERFAYSLELAVRFGKVLIVKNVNSVDPPLLSLFCSAVQSRFNKRLVQVGNKTIDLHDDFKLILITQNEHLEAQLGADLRAQLMELRFTTTVAGLTDVLTFRWVHAKQPAIERKRAELLQEEGKLMKEKLNLQDKLLQELSAAQGDILKNEPLLATLNSIKASAVAIEKSLAEFVQVRDTIMEHYTQRTVLSEMAAKLYMGIRKFYALSVTKYIAIFLSVIDNDKHTGQDTLYSILVRRVYSLLSRSIPKDEQIILGLNVCKQAFPEHLPDREWESFVHNFTNADTSTGGAGEDGPRGLPAWVRPEQRAKVMALQTLLPELYHRLELHNESKDWTRYTEGDEAVAPVSLTEFQQILIAQILRPDLLIRTIHRSVRNLLGLKTLYSTRPSVKALAEESTPAEPLLLVTSSGMDPAEEIREHARQTTGIGLAKYSEFSIGKGLEMEALKLIKDAANTGSWICIKNVHTVPTFLVSTLDDALKTVPLADGFRLWLTSETDRQIGEVFLKKCLKVLYEPPAGLKHKLKLLLEQHDLASIGSKKRDFKTIKLHVGLFLLHSIVQERRSYIPQGWSKRYDFSDADLRTAMDMIQYVETATGSVSTGAKIQWPVVQGLCEKLSYGGRIDNEQDFQRLEHLVREFIDEKIMTSRWQPAFLGITVPNSSHIEDYVKAFDQLPDTDSPTLYGIPASTNASRDLIFCRNTLKALRSQYFSAGTVQNYEKRLRPIVGLWQKLTASSSSSSSHSGAASIVTRFNSLIERSRDSADPWTIFVVSELTIARDLHLTIGETLQALKLALKDAGLLNAKDRALLGTICDNLVPVQWRRLWSGPKTVIEYLRAVTFKTAQAEVMFSTLLEHQTIERVDLNHLFNVEAMLSALKLCRSRELGISTTELTLGAKFGGVNGSSPKNGIQVAPVLIDGGTLKHNKLIIQQTSANQQTAVEAASTGPFELSYQHRPTDRSEGSTRDDTIAIPLYNNISRDVLLCSILMDIGSGLSRSQIIAAGIALIVPESYQ
ncbi:cytoplasmic dynein 2 heavy chain 1-like [Anopheles albimanus]|uniref:cytoplasmic dynein 2 heavy chain 1-like n=1 Tax=Anopheles albimanus TaxID=7167 RepID=UPI001640AADD|nr:cytoplasmic dynein 2 heavy chain 1-like [Anopheles albimanus]